MSAVFGHQFQVNEIYHSCFEMAEVTAEVMHEALVPLHIARSPISPEVYCEI